MRKGFIQIPILAIIAVFLVIGAGVGTAVILRNQHASVPASVSEPSQQIIPTSQQTETISTQASSTPTTAGEITPEVKLENLNVTSTPTSTPKPITITGIVADCRHPYGSLVGISDASVSYADTATTTDKHGRFSVIVPGIDSDPLFEITAPGYVPYRERASRMVKGAFHLIPKEIYRGMDLVLWNREQSNPQNWHRKWEKQSEFVIVRAGASEQQINTVLTLLATDEYRKMTGGRFTSAIQPTIVDQNLTSRDREGKTVISFAPGIVYGGIAHSEDRNGVIYYAAITWDTNQVVDRVIFWHEMFHTVTAGGHINEWPSVVSEVKTTGYVTEMDEQILNCIYNSPPQRTQSDL